MKKLILMLEGEGDVQAVPGLVTRILEHIEKSGCYYIGECYKVGEIHRLVNKNKGANEFIRHLRRAAKVEDIGAVLLLLDCDTERKINCGDEEYEACPKEIAKLLARIARESTAAGTNFSFAAVFARQEFESWILAGCPELDEKFEKKNTEEAPRDAKGKIEELNANGYTYKETSSQKEWTAKIEIDYILKREPRVRSFHRLHNALLELCKAQENNNHISSPNRTS
ncbi:MAG: DUF4276 family protein [Thermoguttaceae bacterium]